MAAAAQTDADRLLQRFRDDFEFYAPRCLRILPKDPTHGLIPFRLNRAQRYLHRKCQHQLREKGWVRLIGLKGRQQGFSTYVEGRFYWLTSTRFGQKAYILTHEDRATANLFGMAKRYHDHVPDEVRPSTSRYNGNELMFEQLQSGYAVGTAKTANSGRSLTCRLFHGSEVAFWANGPSHFAAVGQAIPLAPGTEVILESTSDGMGNLFHELWQGAIAGTNDFEAVFVPWFWQEEYRLPVDDDFVLDPEEQAYMDALDGQITVEHMAWRRWKIRNDFAANPDDFKREYPATQEEAFLASSDKSIIDALDIMRAVNNTRVPPYGPKRLGVDVAEYGDDLSVAIIRQGPVVGAPEAWGKRNLMETAGRIANIAERERPDVIQVDATGLGAGVAARLEELGYPVERVMAGAKADDEQLYYRKRDEMWGRMARWFEEDVHIPDHAQLRAELSFPTYTYDSNRRIRLESKEDMKKRGLKSPDYAEALAQTFASTGVPVRDDVGARGASSWKTA